MTQTVAPPAPPRPGLSSRHHIQALDGVRGVAILLVLLYHFLANVGFTAPGLREIFGILHSGWVGVDLFFVLSGFLITGILFDSKDSPRFFLNFYARRTLRIFPLYYGVLVCVFVILPSFVSFDTPELQKVVHNQAWLWLYGTNLIMGFRESFFFNADWLLLGHFWSLAIEEQFYLLWPAVIRYLTRRQAMVACVAIALSIMVTRILLRLTGDHIISLYIQPFCRMDTLTIGGAVALAAKGPGGIFALRRPAIWVLAFTGVVLAGMYFPTRHLDNVAFAVETVGFTLLALFFGSVIVLAVTAAPHSFAGRFWKLAPLRSLGKYSYGMYVFHLLLLPVYHQMFSAEKLKPLVHSARLAELAFALAAFTATFLAAYLSWHLYEKHFLKLKRAFAYQAPTTGRTSS